MKMKIIAADDERAALDSLVSAIRSAEPDSLIYDFEDPHKVLESVASMDFQPDVAFLDIEMYGMSGIELARKLKDFSPDTRIVFVTAHSQYALKAFSVRARGYLLKPVTIKAVKKELADLKDSLPNTHAGVYVHTFGNFDVYVDGRPVYFHRSKSKEILAYLIDRKGASVTKKEIAAVIWEDGVYSRSRQFQLQTLLAEMLKDLRAAGAGEIARKYHNSYSVDPYQFKCDYYQFLKCDPEAVNSYHGEYMMNYTWSEFTLGALENQKKKF